MAHITGKYNLANFGIYPYCKAEFHLSAADTDADAAYIPDAVSVVIGSDGSIDADLWENDNGSRGTVYTNHVVVYADSSYQREVKRIGMGKIVVIGDAEIQDLLVTNVVPSTQENALALAQAAAASAADDADRADAAADRADADVAKAAASAGQAALYDGPWLDTVTALLADTTLTYTAGTGGSIAAGDIVRTRAEGFSYEVAASGATDQHVTTAGGVKLYVLAGADGAIAVDAFGAKGDGVADDTTAIQKALDTGRDVAFPAASYLITAPLQIGSQRLTGGVGSKWTNRAQTRLVVTGNHAAFVNKAGFPSFQIDGFYIYFGAATPTDSATQSGKIAFYFTTVGGGWPEIVQINNCTVRGAWWTYFDDTGTYLSKLTQVIGRNSRNGFRKSGGTTIKFDTCATADGVVGYYVDNVLSVSLVNCACDLLQVSTTSSVNASGNLFVSCQGLVIDGWDAESNAINTDGGTDAALFRFIDTVGTVSGFIGYLNTFETSGAGAAGGVNLFRAETNSRISILGSQDVFSGAIPYTGTGGYPTTLQADSTSYISAHGCEFRAATGGAPAASYVAIGTNIAFTNSLVTGLNASYSENKTTDGLVINQQLAATAGNFGAATRRQKLHVENGGVAINGAAEVHSACCVLTGSYSSLPSGNSLEVDIDLGSDATVLIEFVAKGVNSSNGNTAVAKALIKGTKIGGSLFDAAVSSVYAARYSVPSVSNVAGTTRIKITMANADGQTFNAHLGFYLLISGTDRASINAASIV